jgi:cytoskeleton protein RodZ
MEATDEKRPNGEPSKSARSVGRILKDARTARSLTLDQVATELRIEAEQLQALEQDEFERIGAPVFVKGFLRQYGSRLGLDTRDLLDLYYRQAQDWQVVVQPSKTIKLRDERQITLWVVAALAIVALAALAFWWFSNSALPVSVSDRAPAEPSALASAKSADRFAHAVPD